MAPLVYDADQVEGLAGGRGALWARIGQASFFTNDEKREVVGYGPEGGPMLAIETSAAPKNS